MFLILSGNMNMAYFTEITITHEPISMFDTELLRNKNACFKYIFRLLLHHSSSVVNL